MGERELTYGEAVREAIAEEMRRDPRVFVMGEEVGLYDGASDISENYEERCGLARSADLRTWERIGSAPAIGAAGGPGTVRYTESVVFRERLLFFFERTSVDGAHELCVSSAPISGSARGSPG